MVGTETAEQLDEGYLRDPYALYTRLREERPVAPAEFNGLRLWLVTRYADVRSALADPRLGKDSDKVGAIAMSRMPAPPQGAGPGGEAPGGEPPEGAPPPGFPPPGPPSPGERMLIGHMLNTDPPDHTRLRGLVGKAFTMRRVEAMRPHVAAAAARLLDAVQSGEDSEGGDAVVADVLTAFAFPLSITVICDLLGVPEADRAKFTRCADGLIVVPDPARLRVVADELAEYLTGLVAQLREHPDDSLISGLVAARDDGDRLSEDELVSMVFQLLVAGYETTAGLIGNGLYALITHPEQLAALRADRSLLPGAIEEFLRHDAPLHIGTMRYTTEAVELAGVTIPENELVVVALGAANHDARRYPDPERFDITREAGGAISFGHGLHHCLGAPLARLVAEVAFTAVLDRFPRIEPAAPGAEMSRLAVLARAWERVPVRFGR